MIHPADQMSRAKAGMLRHKPVIECLSRALFVGHVRQLHHVWKLPQVRMAWDMVRMPSFNPLQLVLDSKAVLGFNLSFFADEHDTIRAYLDQIAEWAASGAVHVPKVTTFQLKDIAEAHKLIQSGRSTGKIVIRTTVTPEFGTQDAATSKKRDRRRNTKAD